jgi:hypothetical protein
MVAIKRPWVPEVLFAMFRWVVRYQPFRWLLTEQAPVHEAACEEDCGGIYRCARCRRLVGWCLGAHDSMPHHCDACWFAEHGSEP